jgi:putative transposase
MQLVEQYRIDRHDSRWAAIDAATFASKNLYNAALYLTRQGYSRDHTIVGYAELDKLPQPTAEYRALPAQMAQWVLRQVCLAWASYFAACLAWEADPSRFLGHPKLPKYRDKPGRNLVSYTIHAISCHSKNAGWVFPSGLLVRIATKRTFDAIAQVRVVPHATHYTVEVVYERSVEPDDVEPQWVAGIDRGVNNLAVVTANQPGFTPPLVNGHPLKALNQLYNIRRAHFQALVSGRAVHLSSSRRSCGQAEATGSQLSSCRQPAYY